MLAQGLVLMAAGMGIVYSFLVVLVFTTKVASGFVQRFESILPDAEPKKTAKKAVSSGGDDADVALAIAVALG